MSAESTPLLEIPGYQDNNDILLKNAKIDTSIAQPSKAIANITISQSHFEEDGYYLVQFKGYTKDEWKQALHDSGAVLYNYVPNNAFITKMNSSVKTHVQTLDSVKWVGPYQPEYRISPALSPSSAIMSQETKQTNVTITVLLFDAIDNERVSGEIMGLGGEIVINSGDRIRAIITTTKIPDISQINGISWIEKYVQPVILNDVAANKTKTYSVRNSHGLTGAGQIVAVADTGLDTGLNDATMHADIRGRIAALHAWWSAYGDSGAEDINGHGTHVTGSVLGNGFKSNRKYSGMAPEARLVFQAMQYDGSGPLVNGDFYIPLDLSSLFQEAYSDGAKIHSNSWGSSDPALHGNYTSDSQYVDSFMWNNRDMLIVFAAGNSGSSGDNTIIPPATAKNAISVGASENLRVDKGGNSDNINDIAYFSSRGFTDDNRIKPDVVAPGTFIISTKSSRGSSYLEILNSYYAYGSGTSMATPIVAGIAALVRQYFMENESISPSAALIKATLINGAINLSLPKNKQGWGRVDIENSLFPTSPRTMRYYENNSGLSINQSWNISYYVENSSELLRITIVWSDYPANPSAGITLVNNLDLIVTGPSGTYYGNGAPDNRNNVEEVELISPSVGLYTIRINGTNIPQGPQPFALVISGALDIYPPTASDEFPINNSYTNNNETAVAVNIKDSGAGINLTSSRMSINGIPVIFTNISVSNGFRIQNVTATPYTDGDVNVSINAIDNASNVFSYSWSFTVDTTPPIITNAQIFYPTGFTAAKKGTPITLNASISDILAGVKNATVNASQINSSLGIVILNNTGGFYKKSGVIVNTSDGTYYLNITAYDNAGNKNDTVQIPVTVDNTPPVLSIVLPKNIPYNTTGISLNVTANEIITTWLYSLNGAANSSFVSPGTTSANTTVTVSTQGLNNITVYANDSAGNWNSSRVNFTVDIFRPVITIASPLNPKYNTTNILLNVSASENSTWLYSLNGTNVSFGSTGTTTANTTITASQGPNTVIVYANDTQNHWNMSTVTFLVDSIAPIITNSYPGNNYNINIFDRTISGSITDNNSITANMTVSNQRLNWTTKGNFSWIANYTLGLNYINITVTDAYNNTNISTTIVNVLSTNETTHNITNGTSVNIVANESTGVDLVLTAGGNNSANVTISINSSINASYFIASNIANDLGRYVEINVTGDRDNLTIVQLTMFYNHSDLDKNGNGLITDVGDLNEDTLNLYWYWDNATSSQVWWPLTNGADHSSKIDRSNHSGPKILGAVERNTTANYIHVTINHFSLYSIAGTPFVDSTPCTSCSGNSGGGGGGGGGGGASGENYSNIEVTEKHDMSIYKDKVTSYRFTNNSSPIIFVNITGNVSFGDITASLEVLRNTSTIVKTAPPGIIYKNANIWVGSSSFNSPRNIKYGAIRFRVMNSWIKKNNIASIRMVKWTKSEWEYLETIEISKDDAFTYYDAFSQMFSNFAITGTKEGTEKRIEIQNILSSTLVEPVQSATPVIEPTKKNPGFGSTLAILCLFGVYIFGRGSKKS